MIRCLKYGVCRCGECRLCVYQTEQKKRDGLADQGKAQYGALQGFSMMME